MTPGPVVSRCLIVALITAVSAVVGQSQPAPRRMVLTPTLACFAAPTRSAPVTRSFHLGDILDPERDTLAGGAEWHSTEAMLAGGHAACWIEDSLTAAFIGEPGESLLETVTSRALEPKNQWRFEDLVAAENLLLGPYQSLLEKSGPLQYARLRIIARASGAADVRGYAPLDQAWVLSHREYLGDDPFGGGLYVLAPPFWKLYETFKSAPWTDDLAWTASQLRRPTDECYSDCVLTFAIVDGPMQYWSRLPAGQHIVAALDAAAGAAKYASDMACYDGRKSPARSDSPVPAGLVDSIRVSLARVTASEKLRLLQYLKEAEAKCR